MILTEKAGESSRSVILDLGLLSFGRLGARLPNGVCKLLHWERMGDLGWGKVVE